MKIKNTTTGDIVIGETLFPAKRSVEVTEAIGAELDSYKDHPGLKHYFDSGKLVASEGEDPEEAPVEDTDDSGLDLRTKAIAEAMKNLDKSTGFLSDGRPRVEAVNSALDDSFSPMTAEERDDIWTKVQAGEA